MNTEVLINKIQSGELDDKILDVYVDAKLLDYQKKRYVEAIRKFEEIYESGEVMIFSAPGRSEVAGNHTDHQHGAVLAASINLDNIGVSFKGVCTACRDTLLSTYSFHDRLDRVKIVLENKRNR